MKIATDRGDSSQSSTVTATRPHKCTFPSCTWSFARLSDLRRHAKSHIKPQYNCPFWHREKFCHRNGGSFNRLDVLKRHLKLIHFVKVDPEDANSDQGWCRACQRIFGTSKEFLEHCDLCTA